MFRHYKLFSAALALSALGSEAVWANLPPITRCGEAGNRATPQLSAADRALARGDARQANLLLDQALRTLGDQYANGSMLDDTGMHLVLAQAPQSKGRVNQAAAIRRKVLTERLHLCGTERK